MSEKIVSRMTRAELAIAKGKTRDAKVLEAAIAEAMAEGYMWITRKAVAQRAGVSTGSVSNSFSRMRLLRRAVLTAAVERGLLKIIKEGLADNHPIALDAPPELKQKALAALLG